MEMSSRSYVNKRKILISLNLLPVLLFVLVKGTYMLMPHVIGAQFTWL